MVLTEQDTSVDFQEGAVILIDKPLEWTSFDVVNKLRYLLKRIAGKIKVGHAGTLDPLATGLLIVCTGRQTKQIERYQGLPKTYSGQFKIGATTPSYDRETEEDRQFDIEGIDLAYLQAATQSFQGPLEQMPPVYSAIKVGGQAAYISARKGKKVELRPRPVEIHHFRILQWEPPLADFEVACSKGTYIRSLAYDFGQSIDNGAYLHSLRRTAIGDFRIQDAWNLEKLISFLQTHYLQPQDN
jgi:tRNA pseudouridine55 synthase